jgi:tRNA dimethylallyltransferase
MSERMSVCGGGTTIEQFEIERLYFGLAIEAQKQIPSLQNSKKRVIVIAGPTGCGKSALSLMLADKIGGEIISADSMQVYQGMDIGTAKPSTIERSLVPHHLIDTRNIYEHFNVVDFYFEARQCCQKILARNNVPIVVGGSGFYLHALIYGPPGGPPSVAEVRKSLEGEVVTQGLEAMYARLHKLDPQYANTIAKNDAQKIIRGLEIILLTGKPVSKLSWKERTKPQTYDFQCWFLHRPKEHLYKRIDRRCEQMLDNGLLQEVIRLEKEGLCSNPSASQAIGYRQALAYLLSEKTEADYKHFVDEFKKMSRHYAKRQMTWFRREPLFRWLDIEMHDYEVIMDQIIREYYSR